MNLKIKTMSEAQINSLKKTNRKTIKEKILDFIKERGTVTEYQIKAILRYNRATIIGRLSELQDEGKIYISGTFNGRLNSRFTYEPDKEKQRQNARKRENERFEKWLKNGLENKYFEKVENSEIQAEKIKNMFGF